MSLYKVSKITTNALIIGFLIVIIVMLSRQGRSSASSGFAAAPLATEATGKAASGPQSIFDIRPDLACTPGPGENASWYSNGLTPGGLCGDNDFVRGQLRDYSIADGIGGSLLEK